MFLQHFLRLHDNTYRHTDVTCVPYHTLALARLGVVETSPIRNFFNAFSDKLRKVILDAYENLKKDENRYLYKQVLTAFNDESELEALIDLARNDTAENHGAVLNKLKDRYSEVAEKESKKAAFLDIEQVLREMADMQGAAVRGLPMSFVVALCVSVGMVLFSNVYG